MKAKIKWLIEEQGGRHTIPFSDKYGPVVVIKGSTLNLNEEAWSLIVNNKEVVSDYETIAEVNIYLKKLLIILRRISNLNYTKATN